MATTIRRSFFVAALAAALSLVLAACGGGGGGGSTPPNNPPPAGDTAPPRVTSVTPTNGATGVAPTTSVVVTYEDASNLKCSELASTVSPGGYEADVMCDGAAKKVTLAFRTALPLGATVPAVVPSVSDMAGNPAPAVNVTFTVAAPVVTTPKVYVGVSPQIDGSRAVAVIDTATNAVKHIGFPGVPGFQALNANVVDALTGKVYFAPSGGFQIYVVDLVTDAVLAPIKLDPAFTVNHLIWDLVLLETEFCAAMSDSAPAGISRNRLQCWDRFTNAVTYNGANNSLAADNMFTTRLKYVNAPTKKLYALNALRTAVNFPPPGTPGTLVAIDPVTKAVIQTYNVGSGADEFDVDPRNGDVWVANPGDETVSIVHPSTGQVETWVLDPLWFNGAQQMLSGLALDPGKDRVYLTNGQVLMVYELSTHRKIDVVNLGVGSVPGRIMVRDNEIWVACAAGHIAVVSRDTLAVLRTITVGSNPNAFASYAPGNSQ